MGININDLNCDLNYNYGQANDFMPTENIRELTEQEQQISGGGTGNFSLTVTDGKGQTLINENKSFNTGSLSLDADLDVVDVEPVTLRNKPVAVYYPNIVGFAYFFDDDDDDDTSSNTP